MKYLLSGLLFSLIPALQACQPQPTATPAQRQQQFVCTSLIDGFLKVSHQGAYQLNKIEQIDTDNKTSAFYQYSISSDHNVRLNHPTQKDLLFRCDKSPAETFQLFLLETTSSKKLLVLSLHLPEQTVFKQLTAYHMK